MILYNSLKLYIKKGSIFMPKFPIKNKKDFARRYGQSPSLCCRLDFSVFIKEN